MDNLQHYQTSLNWTGKRGGRLEGDGLPALPAGAPPEFGGEPGVWTPEHLLVAAANLCLMTTFLAMAEFSKLEVGDWSSSARGTVEKLEGQGWLFTAIEIEAKVTVARASDLDRARRLVEKAERNCLVSRSMKTPVTVKANVTAREVVSAGA